MLEALFLTKKVNPNKGTDLFSFPQQNAARFFL
jgi:hypothetical protein